MFILGVTGPSGAGKGTACQMLKQVGFCHIDTDRLVPALYPKALSDLIREFGAEIEEDGSVNKKNLAAAAFCSPEATKTLNSILHPLVMEEVVRLIQKAKTDGFSRVAVDGAALLEANGAEVCDKILCILSPANVRAKRVAKRDHIDNNAILQRFQAQKSDEYYANNSDAVIVNDTPDQLKEDLLNLIKEWDYE